MPWVPSLKIRMLLLQYPLNKNRRKAVCFKGNTIYTFHQHWSINKQLGKSRWDRNLCRFTGKGISCNVYADRLYWFYQTTLLWVNPVAVKFGSCYCYGYHLYTCNDKICNMINFREESINHSRKSQTFKQWQLILKHELVHVFTSSFHSSKLILRLAFTI